MRPAQTGHGIIKEGKLDLGRASCCGIGYPRMTIL
jgi:hypothetical protein